MALSDRLMWWWFRHKGWTGGTTQAMAARPPGFSYAVRGTDVVIVHHGVCGDLRGRRPRSSWVQTGIRSC
jgi:hypothetical protein